MKTRNYKLLTGILFFLFFSINAIKAQDKRCGTTEAMQKLREKYPQLIQQEAAYEAEIQNIIKNNMDARSGEVVVTIPVVFHILHTYGPENISDAQIADQMAILNRDFRKLNADTSVIVPPFDTLASDIRIEFKLAQLDPWGNCTNGIDRIYTHKTNNGNDQAKLNQWPRDKYLNIWTVKSMEEAGVAGYTFQPATVDGFLFFIDGIIILHDYIGSIGTASVNNSRALTHEVGHWLNLPHTWGSTNQPTVACGDDGVNDTPVTKGHNNCSNTKDYFCSSKDFHNTTKPTTYNFNNISVNKNIVANYDFTGVNTASGLIDPTSPPDQNASAGNTMISFTNFKAVGVTGNSATAGSFNFVNWGTGSVYGGKNGDTTYANHTGAVNPLKYYEFQVKPESGYDMTLSDISFFFKRNATGVRTFVVRSSVDGYTANLPAVVWQNNGYFSVRGSNVFYVNSDSVSPYPYNGCKVVLSGAGFTNTTSPVTFRIYAYNPENATGLFEVDNVSIGGTFSSAMGTTDPTPAPSQTVGTTNAIAVGMSSFKAVGVSSSSLASGSFAFSGWDLGGADDSTNYAAHTGTLNTSKYYEFVVHKPRSGYAMRLTGITFTVKRDTAGTRTYAVRSSVDNFTANLPASVTANAANLSVQTGNIFYIKKDTTASFTGSKITLSGANYTDIYDTVKFRIYAFNAEGTTGTFEVDNVALTGTYGEMENVQNYMEYSYCSKMFTKGQKARMRAAVLSSIAKRSSLITTSNLIATGLAWPMPGCKPKPDFSSNNRNICEGGTVTFTKNILNATATSLQWTFTGGTPATSTSTNPVTVTYSTAGTYPVKLVATNAAGTDSVVKNYFVIVTPNTANVGYNGGISYDFENSAQYVSHWQVNDLDWNQKTWSLVNNAGYSGTSSIKMQGFGNYANDVDEIITPGYHLAWVTGNVLTFRCAAATTALQSLDIDDELKVYTSANCGQSWQLRASFKAATLINNGYSATAFTPTNQSQWALKTVSSIPSGANIRIKFEYITGRASNNIYIDDINISGLVGIDENNLSEAGVALFPNPTTQTTTLFYNLNNAASVKIELFDISGKKITEIANGTQAEGSHTYEISKQALNLNSGIYFVRLTLDNASLNKKLILTE